MLTKGLVVTRDASDRDGVSVVEYASKSRRSATGICQKGGGAGCPGIDQYDSSDNLMMTASRKKKGI